MQKNTARLGGRAKAIDDDIDMSISLLFYWERTAFQDATMERSRVLYECTTIT
jgi:hypothetical protein